MKKIAVSFNVVLLIVLLLFGCGSNLASSSTGSISAGSISTGSNLQPRLVTVTGDAEVRVIPDEVVITLGMETQDEDLGAAKSRNDEVIQQVFALSQDLGIDANHIQTDFIDIEPMYNYTASGGRRLEGYRVRQTIVVILGDLSQFEDFLSGALERGVNYVHDVEFRTTELRRYRDQARALAIQAAQEKAGALAGELNQAIGEPVMIQEERGDWWSWYGYGWGSRGNSGVAQNMVVEVGSSSLGVESGIAPGQITVRAQVTASFALK